MIKTKFKYLFWGSVLIIMLVVASCGKDLPQLPQIKIDFVQVELLDSLYMSASIQGIRPEDRGQVLDDEGSFGFIILNEKDDEVARPSAKWEEESGPLTFLASYDSVGLNVPIKVVAFVESRHQFYNEVNDNLPIYYSDTLEVNTDSILFTHEFKIDNNPAITIQTGILSNLRLSETAEVGHIWALKEDSLWTGELVKENADSFFAITDEDKLRRFYENTVNLYRLGVSSTNRYLFVRGYIKYRNDTTRFYGKTTQTKLGNFWEKVATNTNSVGCRYKAVGFEAGGYGYVGFGNNRSDCKNRVTGRFLSDFWRYNPKNKKWKEMQVFPGDPRMEANGFVVNNRIFVGLGRIGQDEYLDDLWEFIPDEGIGNWKNMEVFPEFRGSAISFVIKDTAYIGTGRDESDDNLTYKRDFYQYIPIKGEKGRWNKLEKQLDERDDFGERKPLARINAAAFSLKGKGYICSGLALDKIPNDAGKVPNNKRQDLWIYDTSCPKDNNWCRGENLPGSPREGAIGFNDNEYGYLIGGGESNENGSACALESDFWRYDPINDTWKELAQMPDRRIGGIGLVLKDTIYAGFGHITSTSSTCDNGFYRYIPEN